MSFRSGKNSKAGRADDYGTQRVLHEIREFAGQSLEKTKSIVIGQQENLSLITNAFLNGGHILISGLPGLGKTLAIRTVARVWDYEFRRIQFTPDTMPSDILGSEILQEKPDKSGRKEFVFSLKKGPVFTNILLADEINRTPPKTQSAMLQAMEEKTVSLGNETHRLPEPFFVLATRNPIELEGTYPLPEAQVDRFFFYLDFGYPTENEEISIALLDHPDRLIENIEPVTIRPDLENWRKALRSVPVPENVFLSLVRSVRNTRPGKESPIASRYARYGAGTRATQMLLHAAQAEAAISGEPVVHEKILEKVFFPVLRHRISLNYAAAADGITVDEFLSQCLDI